MKTKLDPVVKPRDCKSSSGSTTGSKNSKKFLTRLARVECPDTTYFGKNFPTVFKKGQGIYITDVDNKKYLDFTSCFGVLALGHRAPTTLKALKKQSAKLIHGMGDIHPTEPKIKLLELLAKMTPFTQPKSMLGLSGGDAVEIAMKTSILATGRSKFISFSGGYHGVQLAPLHLNHTKFFTQNFTSLLTNHALELPFPYFAENGPKHSEHTLDPNEVLNLLEEHLRSKLYAGLILEPIQGRGGIRIFSKDFLQECKNLCKKYGTLLVFDEIMTGFGRTGKMFGYEHSGVIPDLMCLGKAMGGGLPLSVCIGDIMDTWKTSTGEACHTQTFLGNPLACAVGYDAILHIKNKLPLFQKELLDINKQFDIFLTNLKNISSIPPCFIRGVGFMRGLWFYTQDNTFGPAFVEKLFLKNFLLLPEGIQSNVVAILPPLIATQKDFKNLFITILKCL